MQIYINGKYLQKDRFTGVDNVANNYSKFLNTKCNVKYIPYEFRNKYLYNLEEQLIPFRLSFSKDDIIIHFTNTAPYRKCSCREILFLHDMAFLDFPEEFSTSFLNWYKLLVPHLLNTKEQIITVSDFSKRRILHHFSLDESKIRVIPNGFDFSDDLKFRDGNYFLLVGGNSPRKNIRSVIKAHKCFPNKIRSTYPLYLVGDYSSSNFEREEISEDSYIKNMGYVSEQRLRELYENSLTVINASKYEGFGLPILESINFGKLPIASKIPPHVEILGNSYDFYFNPINYLSLKNAMGRYIDQKDKLNNNYEILSRGIRDKYLLKNSQEKLLNTIERFV